MDPGVPRTVYLGWQFFLRDFRLRYRRAYLGFIWSLAPLVTLGAALVAVGTHGRLPGEDVPYATRIFFGLVYFQVFFDGVLLPQQMARRSRSLLSSTPIPYGALSVAAAVYALTNYLMRLPLLVMIAVCQGASIHPEVALAMLVSFPLLLLSGLSLGQALTAPSLLLHDIRYSMPLVQSVLFLLTPILYTMPASGYLGLANRINPLTHLIGSAVDWSLAGSTPHTGPVAWSALPILIVAILSSRFFTGSMKAVTCRI